MTTRRWLLCALVAARAAAVSAGENPGTTAAPVLQLPIGARAVGMGCAYTALSDDSSAMYYNPAGLSSLSHHEVAFMYMKGFEDQKLEHIAAAVPMPFGLIGDYATLGVSGLFSQNGTIEVNRTKADGSFLSQQTLSAGSDMVGAVSYSERVANMDVRAGKKDYRLDHLLGITGKMIRSTLAETYSASAAAFDLGYLLKAPEAGLSLGASLLNAGSKMTFVSVGDPLPLTTRFGAAFSPAIPETTLPASQSLTFAADGEYLMHEEQWHMNFGAEYSAWRNYAVRLGYRFHREAAGLTFGFGAAWRGLGIDYAWAMSDDLTDVHRFSVTYRFGKLTSRRRETQRRPFIEPENIPESDDLQDIEQRRPESLDEPERPRRTPSDRPKVAPGWIY